ncbi:MULTISPECIES: hypothetical protein [Gordonia]|uniref:Uncharacterized protein n=1 Tax=Gordonia amicalis TaxID=89053 RepID=A0AAE4UAC8_9ACTN|nr:MULTISPECIES: hypothetical protein [Gordonia]ATD70967.1 hypothetical protein CNO18_12525 [Gordonia sp. 1D]MCZ0913071.1 hypothetical protein [Gordonia amicalis]MCZ4581335.1 hypothetical protein [Gordonia amicalis]MCZ4653883.1 hypothetical protein [Gordonia amicalis]MDJ0455333.1 hypothetical protein [Gordonia amicalis]
MVTRAATVPDLEAALGAKVDFCCDPDDDGWYRGTADGTVIFVRMGNFPDEEAYSLYLGHGRWMDFTCPPKNWRIDTTGGWPSTARARLPKGQFW